VNGIGVAVKESAKLSLPGAVAETISRSSVPDVSSTLPIWIRYVVPESALN